MKFRLMGGCLTAVVLCLFAANQIHAAEALQWHSDLKKAALESQRSQKPMLIEITADWCTYCKKMKTTFQHETIVRHVNGCFIPVTVDADENEKLVEAVGADALPTTVIVSPKFKLLKKITGYYTPQQFESKLGEICLANHEVVQTEPVSEQKVTPPAAQPAIPVIPVKAVTPQPNFGGYCLVSLLDEQKLRLCKGEFSSQYKGALLYFDSAEQKQKFDANPARYWPALDGHCPIRSLVEKKPIPGKPNWGAIYQARLWFFADKESRNEFAKAPANHVSRLK